MLLNVHFRGHVHTFGRGACCIAEHSTTRAFVILRLIAKTAPYAQPSERCEMVAALALSPLQKSGPMER